MGKICDVTWRAIAVGLYGGAPPNGCSIPSLVNWDTTGGSITESQKPVTPIPDNSARPSPPGCEGKNHYKFVDALGAELAYIGISSTGYSITYKQNNCQCTPDSCRVDCSTAPDGFCCIDHSLTDRLLQILKN